MFSAGRPGAEPLDRDPTVEISGRPSGSSAPLPIADRRPGYGGASKPEGTWIERRARWPAAGPPTSRPRRGDITGRGHRGDRQRAADNEGWLGSGRRRGHPAGCRRRGRGRRRSPAGPLAGRGRGPDRPGPARRGEGSRPSCTPPPWPRAARPAPRPSVQRHRGRALRLAAGTRGRASVALPALGTGNGGFRLRGAAVMATGAAKKREHRRGPARSPPSRSPFEPVDGPLSGSGASP